MPHRQHEPGRSAHGRTPVARRAIEPETPREVAPEPADWGIAVLDAACRQVVRGSAILERMLGYAPGTLERSDVTLLFAPAARPEVLRHLGALLVRGECSFQSTALRPDDSTFPVAVDGVAFTDGAGRAWRCVLHLEDRTWRRALEEALDRASRDFAEIRAQLTTFIEQAPDGIFVADLDGRYTAVNTAGCQLLGCEPEDIIGKTIVDLLPPEEVQRLWDSRAQLLAGSSQVAEWHLRHKNGTYVPVEVNAKILADGRWQGFVRDITERKSLEAAVQASEARFRILFESGPDALLVTDATGRIQAANAEAETLLGYARDELVGQPLEVLVPASLRDEHAQWCRDFSASTTRRLMARGRALRAIRKDGVHFFAEVGLSPLETPEGPRVVSALRDITDRVRTQEEIRRKSIKLQAVNRELEAFSHAVSHDLRAPLRALCSYSEILLADLGESIDEDGRHMLVRMQAGAQRMAELLDALQALSRISGTPIRNDPVDLAAIARGVADELRREAPERHVEFRLTSPLEVQGDPALLANVVDNLFRNAWKFTAGRPDPFIELGSTERDGEIAYFVRDNGVGFDPALAKDLFLPFRRAHDTERYAGTGIGLATVERIIRRHGGRVWAEGRPGEGATFYFTL